MNNNNLGNKDIFNSWSFVLPTNYRFKVFYGRISPLRDSFENFRY